MRRNYFMHNLNCQRDVRKYVHKLLKLHILVKYGVACIRDLYCAFAIVNVRFITDICFESQIQKFLYTLTFKHEELHWLRRPTPRISELDVSYSEKWNYKVCCILPRTDLFYFKNVLHIFVTNSKKLQCKNTRMSLLLAICNALLANDSL